MKIAIIGDNHIFYGDQHQAVMEMMELIKLSKPDIVLNLGDIGEILIADDMSLVQELFSIKPTVFVLGNHDLYTRDGRYTPPEAFNECIKKIKYGIPLQKSWTDSTTTFEKDGYLFLGSILFPDHASPKLPMSPEYYDHRYPTVDGTYIDLREGWLKYTTPLMEAFEKKLKLVDKSKCSNVVIITHYCCFESQYRFNPNEEISNYFFCYTAGQLVKQVAERNPDKNFYCIGAHGHEYNRGECIKETDNLTVMGFVNNYNQQKFIILEFPFATD